jgi:cytochrome b6-f complex iron-sulfur subunit
MDRRKFLKGSAIFCGLAVVGPALLVESCKKIDTSAQGPTVNFTIDLSQSANSALNTVGGSGSSNGVVIVNMGTNFIAIAQRCTHSGCSVAYSSTGNDFECPCHGAKFDLNGAVTHGPAQIALKKYTVTQSGNILTVVG